MKIFTPFKYLCLMAFAVAGLTACHDDDDDLPNVDMRVDVKDATVVNGNIYVVEGLSFDISSITVTNNEPNRAAFITSAAYYWDYEYIGTNFVDPFGLNITITPSTPLGKHLLQINCPLYAVDKAPAVAYLEYTVVVVKDESEIPDGDRSTYIIDNPNITKDDKK